MADGELNIVEAVSVTSLVEARSASGPATLELELIRPCVGRGKGRHLYEASMLARDAGNFSGWKMGKNHLTEAEKRALGGMPRRIEDLAGILTESWWDPNVPADPKQGFGEGAVMGRAKVVPLIEELVKTDPRLVSVSIHTTATGVRPRTVNGQTVNVVEGIAKQGTVDFVSEAGAGGRVASIVEALVESADLAEWEETARLVAEEDTASDVEEMDDAGFMEYLRSRRPELVEAIRRRHVDDEESATRRREDPDGSSADLRESEEDDVAEINPALLSEALSSEEGRNALVEALKGAGIIEALQESVTERLDEERDLLRFEAQAYAARQAIVRDLHTQASATIAEAKLPEQMKDRLRKRYAIVDGKPSASLDVYEVREDDGTVTKSAGQALAEALASDIEDDANLYAALAPTRVSGLGSGTNAEGEQDSEGPKEPTNPPVVESFFSELGIPAEKLTEVYG